jgi:hypothetical protein
LNFFDARQYPFKTETADSCQNVKLKNGKIADVDFGGDVYLIVIVLSDKFFDEFTYIQLSLASCALIKISCCHFMATGADVA